MLETHTRTCRRAHTRTQLSIVHGPTIHHVLFRPTREESVHVDADEAVGDMGTSAEAGKHQEEEEEDNLSQHTRDPGL